MEVFYENKEFSIFNKEVFMESILGIIFSAENVRMLVLLAFGFSAYVLMKSQMKGLEYRISGVETSLNSRISSVEMSLNNRISGVETSLNSRVNSLEASLNSRMDRMETSLFKAMDEKIDAFHSHLKANDFAHLNDSIVALTFTLEKSRFLEKEDKKYIDGRLER
jgi:hypothetical protein